MKQKFHEYRRLWGDFHDRLRTFKTPPLRGNPRYGLSDTQVYPSGDNIPNLLLSSTIANFSTLSLRPSRKMASIGTCFAEEFAQYLKRNPDLGQYVLVEDNVFNSSANWGRVYTTENLLQIIKYSFDEQFPLHLEETSKGLIDPLREHSVGHFNTEAEAVSSIRRHRQLSRKVFLDSDVLVITLGQNECWYHQEKRYFWGTTPSSEWLRNHPDNAKPHEIDYQRNLEIMRECLEKLHTVNPRLKVILTVSPVPSAATFLSSDVVSQSMAGKSVLRAVAHQIQKSFQRTVYYFPSFEMVLCNNPTSFRSDNRHVRYRVVKKIFLMLKRSLPLG